jgi:hypothetical protein
MEAFKKGILAWAVVPLITGAIAILVGPPFWRLVGMELSAPGFSDPILDSQVRFLGTVWFGYGVLMCVCARDLKKYAGLLRTALLLVFLGGIARLASIAVVGMPDAGAALVAAQGHAAEISITNAINQNSTKPPPNDNPGQWRAWHRFLLPPLPRQ